MKAIIISLIIVILLLTGCASKTAPTDHTDDTMTGGDMPTEEPITIPLPPPPSGLPGEEMENNK